MVMTISITRITYMFFVPIGINSRCSSSMPAMGLFTLSHLAQKLSLGHPLVQKSALLYDLCLLSKIYHILMRGSTLKGPTLQVNLENVSIKLFLEVPTTLLCMGCFMP